MGSGDSQCHVGRQPILNRAQRIIGYQLMFRDNSQADQAEVSDEIGATARVIVNALSNIGTETLLGEGVGFISCDPTLAIGEMVADLPGSRLVLQLGEMDVVTPAFKKRLEDLHDAGVRFALSDFTKRDNRVDLLEFSSYAKVRADSDTRSGLRALMRTLNRSGVQVIGTHVETHDQQEMLAGIDVGLYQGYFFAEPQIVSGEKIDPERSEVLRLIVELEKDVEIEAIADRFKKSPSLSVNLLRLVNGLKMARAQKIDSVSQALMMMGRQGLSRWLSLLLFAGSEESGSSSPVFKLGAARGRIMECLESDPADVDNDDRNDAGERAFITGMFSLIHVVLGSTPAEMLQEVSVSDEVRAALLEREGRLGQMLVLMEKVEAGDFDAVDNLLENLDLSSDQLQAAQVEAYNWLKSM